MKKLLLVLLIVGAAFLAWKYRQWKQNPNLLTNGDFEAQEVPERVAVWTNHVTGWRVDGTVCLYRDGTNTVVAIPYGSAISQPYKAKVDEGYMFRFTAAEQHPGEFRPWRVIQRGGIVQQREGEFTIPSKTPGAMVYADNCSVKRHKRDVDAGNLRGWAENEYSRRGFTGLEGKGKYW